MNEQNLHRLLSPGSLGSAWRPSQLSDAALEARLKTLVLEERECTADVVEYLMVADERKLFLQRHYRNLFEYCRYFLGYPEGAAFKRIRAARAAQVSSLVLPMLRSGRLHLSATVLLHPHLDAANAHELLETVSGLSKREIEALLADRFGTRLASRDKITPGRRQTPETASETQACSLPLAAENSGEGAPQADCPEGVKPVLAASPELAGLVAMPREYRFGFTADADFRRLLYRAQALLRHKYPDGRLAGVLYDALKLLVAKRDPIYRAELKRKHDSETLGRARRSSF